MKHPKKKSIFVQIVTWLVITSFSTTTAASAFPLENQIPEAASPSTRILIPREFSTVIETRRGSLPQVILIQDAHCLYEAQKNIARSIQFIAGQKPDSFPKAQVFIAVEGAEGPIDMTPFRNFNPEIRRKLTDFYMRKGLLSGAEYAAINMFHQAQLVGLEKSELYERNRGFYLQAYEKQNEALQILKKLQKKLDSIKEKIYSQELLLVDRRGTDFEMKRLNLLEYFDFLKQKAGHEMDRVFPYLKRFDYGLELEKKVDFKIAEDQREKLLAIIKAKLLEKGSHEPLLALLRAKKDSRSFGFEKTLLKQAESLGIDLKSFSNLAHYVDYLEAAETVEGPELFRELSALTQDIKNRLFRSQEEREKDAESNLLKILERIVRLEATRPEFEEVRAKRSRVPSELQKSIEPAFHFYEEAWKRDQVLFEGLDSVIQSARKNEGSLVFLIAGGFHTAGLRELLSKRKVAYQILSPLISHEVKENPYSELMRGWHSDLRLLAAAFKNDFSQAIQGENQKRIKLPDGREVFYRFHLNQEALDLPQEKLSKVELVKLETSPFPFFKRDEKRKRPLQDFTIQLKRILERKSCE